VSVTVDANVLIYATNERDPVHAQARALVERLMAGPEIAYLFWPALMGYLRIVTQPRLLPDPLTAAEAMGNVARLVAPPHVRTPGERDGFWELFRATADGSIRGNDVPDAHLATLMRQHGVGTIYTRDRGFRRYDGIRMEDPFA
jgi:toxin-antitoxin system PIN domain toxin